MTSEQLTDLALGARTDRHALERLIAHDMGS